MQTLRGDLRPLFYYPNVMNTQLVEEKIVNAIEGEGAFLVEYTVGSDNQIRVKADHPEGITLEKLASISRKVEAEFDRDEEDFSIEVASPGVGAPLKVKQQYHLAVGRFVKVETAESKVIEGKLSSFDDDVLTITWKERVPKEVGKGKRTVVKEEKLHLADIKETRLEIRF